MRQKTGSKIAQLIDQGFDLQLKVQAQKRKLKETEDQLNAVKEDLLKAAEKGNWRTYDGQTAMAEVSSRTENKISPDALFEYLERSEKMHLAPILTKVLVGAVSKFLGEDVLEDIGSVEVKAFHSMKFKQLRT